MREKNIFLKGTILLILFMINCGGAKTSSSPLLLGLLGGSSSSESSSSQSGYYFQETGFGGESPINIAENEARKVFHQIPLMTSEIRAAVNRFDSSKGKDLGSATAPKKPASDEIWFIYENKLAKHIPSDQKANIKALITAAIDASKTTAYQTVPKATVKPNPLPNSGFVKQAYDFQGQERESLQLMSQQGVSYVQYIEKGLFSITYSEGMKILDGVEAQFDKDVAAAKSDPEKDPKKSYTDAEKQWDNLFAWFGAPQNYSIDSNKSGFLEGQLEMYIGYAMNITQNSFGWQVADVAGQNTIKNLPDNIMEKGFIAGRNAITNQDKAGLKEAIRVVRLQWECAIVLGALFYIWASYQDFASDDKIKDGKASTLDNNQTLSEAFGMIWSLHYGNNSSAQLKKADLEFILNKLSGANDIQLGTGDNVSASKGNLYDVTSDDLKAARKRIIDNCPSFKNSLILQ